MLDIRDYRKISLEFRRVASNLLKTKYTDGNIPLIRFKNYIDSTEIIHNIILDKINGIECDYETFIVRDDSGWNKVNIPIDESEHIKSMYDYIDYLVNSNTSIERIALGFLCSSKSVNDHLQYFLDLAFKPFVDFINDELSKILIMKEEKMNIDFSHNQGNINIADHNSSIESNFSTVDNDIGKIIELIEVIKNQMNDLEINDKDLIIDDIEIIDEQLKSSIPKPARLKKAFNNIKGILTNAAMMTGTGITIATNINQLIQYIQPILEKMGLR